MNKQIQVLDNIVFNIVNECVIQVLIALCTRMKASLCAKTWKLFTQNYEKNIFFISFHRLAVAPISDIWQQICTCRYFRYLYEIMLDK